MPRRAGFSSFSGTNNGPLAEIRAGLGLDDRKEAVPNGYEVESVCTPCLSMLQGEFYSTLDLYGMKAED